MTTNIIDATLNGSAPGQPGADPAPRVHALRLAAKRLSVRGRALTAIASLLLLGAFVLPLWLIRLAAPQYPEGLGMVITLSNVTGAKEHDLENINGLNHYIGMRKINPDAIPVLHVMPWVVGGLIVSGLLVALIGRRRLLDTWMTVFGVAAIAGLAEFWWWEYDFGHNLDMVNAIIKIPGMNYQPPLIGSKQLLNFTATSIPAYGAWVVGVAFLLGALALIDAHRTHSHPPAHAPAD